MVAKLVAGACIVALAAGSQFALFHAEQVVGRPLVMRASVPLPFGGEHGYASLSSSWGSTRWRFAATWTGGKERERLSLLLAAEPEEADAAGDPPDAAESAPTVSVLPSAGSLARSELHRHCK